MGRPRKRNPSSPPSPGQAPGSPAGCAPSPARQASAQRRSHRQVLSMAALRSLGQGGRRR
ncbi:unnamed protein product [Spirodela intermedia]|uniref:Uncharacterized protein n=1 Tax=Spirodela intermedia TaxID=51605 RepID=A0A7I8LDB4_SPIIN|nr:unnamed protein product [Spirodela intermedia]